jgi:hypothetical protein
MRYTGEIMYEGVKFEVRGDYVPYSPGRAYLNNGDPGYPPEGGCFDNFSVYVDGQELTGLLENYVVDGIEELALKEAAEC